MVIGYIGYQYGTTYTIPANSGNKLIVITQDNGNRPFTSSSNCTYSQIGQETENIGGNSIFTYSYLVTVTDTTQAATLTKSQNSAMNGYKVATVSGGGSAQLQTVTNFGVLNNVSSYDRSITLEHDTSCLIIVYNTQANGSTIWRDATIKRNGTTLTKDLRLDWSPYQTLNVSVFCQHFSNGDVINVATSYTSGYGASYACAFAIY